MKKKKSDKKTFLLSFAVTFLLLTFFAALYTADDIMRGVTGESEAVFSIRRAGNKATTVTFLGEELHISDKIFTPVGTYLNVQSRFYDFLVPDEVQYAAYGTYSLLASAGKTIGSAVKSSFS